MVTKTQNGTWRRKHDDPSIPIVAEGAQIYYPKDLADLIAICGDQTSGAYLHAAGSHWALSNCAMSDHSFIESHDPNGIEQAMGKTLDGVLLNCLSADFVGFLLQQDIPDYTTSDLTPAQKGAIYPMHIESGKRIYQAYSELDSMLGSVRSLADSLSAKGNAGYSKIPWAFSTLGSAGGQTVLGALSTGTHGGDFDRPPLSDAVLAIHLVADGGQHYWIEPQQYRSSALPAALTAPSNPIKLTDPVAIQNYYSSTVPNAPPIKHIADDDLFESVLVSVGRFGAIYSLIVVAVPQYNLSEVRTLDTWQNIRADILDPNSSLFKNKRFLQIAVNHVPKKNFTVNTVGITERVENYAISEARGRAERVGGLVNLMDAQLQAPSFENAGRNFAFPSDQAGVTGKSPTFFEAACANSDFLAGVLDQIESELMDFLTNGVCDEEILAGVLAPVVLTVVLPALAPLLLALSIKVACAKPTKDALLQQILTGNNPPSLGAVLGTASSALLQGATPEERAAGLLIWQALANKIFDSMQGPATKHGLSYAVMDAHDYKEHSCNANVDSIEVFFPAHHPMLVAYIDHLLNYEKWQEVFMQRSHVGYVALRFMKPSVAKLAPQQFNSDNMVCSVEISGLLDAPGTRPFIDYAAALALNPNFGGILHWGQRNPSSRQEVEFRFGGTQANSNISVWRKQLDSITNGSFNRFSNSFTRQTGLETI